MDATQALRDAENALRDFIAERLAQKLGTNWENQLGVKPDKILKWTERRDEERRKIKGVTIEERLLYYSDFYDIGIILRKHWDLCFKDVFYELKTLDAWLSELEKYRDTDAHRRELFEHQKHLIIGISGEIRSRLAQFRSKMENIDSYFPRIESVRDSIGSSSGMAGYNSPKTVKVGDLIEFVVTAIDPIGEDLEYSIGWVVESWQKSNLLSYTFTSKDVGRHKEIFISIRSTREYHAKSGYDDAVTFTYHVLPPSRNMNP